MVIDSSAIIAILFEELEAQWFEAAISKEIVRIMSAASLVESLHRCQPPLWRSSSGQAGQLRTSNGNCSRSSIDCAG
jgi:uncharacterized protein with PIN domain